MSIRKGAEWGVPAEGPADLTVTGSDADLAAAVRDRPGALVRYVPDGASDLARAVGLGPAEPSGVALSMDALALGDGTLAVNMVVAGRPPDRLTRFARSVGLRVRLDGSEWFSGNATTVLCAVGQWLRANDVVPRGHPGDGRAEMQAFRLRPGERSAMRARLRAGDHVPHPRILQRTGRELEIVAARPAPLEIDGAPRAPVSRLVVRLVPGAYRLLV